MEAQNNLVATDGGAMNVDHTYLQSSAQSTTNVLNMTQVVQENLVNVFVTAQGDLQQQLSPEKRRLRQEVQELMTELHTNRSNAEQ